MKALVGAFNQEKALVGAFSVIVRTGCGTDGALQGTIEDRGRGHTSLNSWLVTLRQPAPGAWTGEKHEDSMRKLCLVRLRIVMESESAIVHS